MRLPYSLKTLYNGNLFGSIGNAMQKPVEVSVGARLCIGFMFTLMAAKQKK
jgi:hypothetical protein